jgi:hypothetical protein
MNRTWIALIAGGVLAYGLVRNWSEISRYRRMRAM